MDCEDEEKEAAEGGGMSGVLSFDEPDGEW